MQGGTFTISNGGVYGSLMSTPILNAPQSGHPRHAQDPGAAGGVAGKDRGAADDVSRAAPTTTASSTGREAVTFLVRVKEGAGGPGTAGAGFVMSSSGRRAAPRPGDPAYVSDALT
jgi:pyruvate/2-oxoglutarate dehydrogenase complex dihydrolipoamide acyltransferase (E2) component